MDVRRALDEIEAEPKDTIQAIGSIANARELLADALENRSLLIVARHGRLEQCFQHGTLVAKRGIDGLHRHARLAGQCIDGRGLIAPLREQLATSRNNRSTGLAAQRRVLR